MSAIAAAEVYAKLRLAEWISGTQVEGLTIVGAGAFVTDTARTSVQAHIPGGTTIDEEYDESTGEAKVTMEFLLDATPSP